ncbi:hypothetical protein AZZ94_002960, partial [Enterobacter hormaechei]
GIYNEKKSSGNSRTRVINGWRSKCSGNV